VYLCTLAWFLKKKSVKKSLNHQKKNPCGRLTPLNVWVQWCFLMTVHLARKVKNDALVVAVSCKTCVSRVLLADRPAWFLLVKPHATMVRAELNVVRAIRLRRGYLSRGP